MDQVTIMVGDKAMTMDEINIMLASAKSLNAQVKAVKKDAKAKGIKLTEDKEPKVKSAEYVLLVANFLPTLEANAETISKLFANSRSDANDVTSGQDSISFNVTDEYQVIIRSSSVTKAKKAKRDAEAKALKANTTTEAPKTE
jgi:hypothetical protein